MRMPRGNPDPYISQSRRFQLALLPRPLDYFRLSSTSLPPTACTTGVSQILHIVAHWSQLTLQSSGKGLRHIHF
ncbi:hypothetical protein WJX77_012585 [Trebouxia sp. C0004]